ncbi:unnamed protein product [Rotaria sordida]|uniref:Uncharacterized protein n=2 Tax=Rotaria sordida TaxID=392033 RepID=A0A819NUJ5_9BILA|nr:unnamed protein product [Rotaria sordida]CAF1396706.1 unnamed protein product [Rotaria sordida]CAF4000327.1 unnamed protein product [Rotaria sordida]
MSTTTSTIAPMIMDEKTYQQQQRKDQQESVTDSMITLIIQAEDTIYEYQQLFHEEMRQLFVNEQNENKGST